jgi:hypothetical protein
MLIGPVEGIHESQMGPKSLCWPMDSTMKITEGMTESEERKARPADAHGQE